MRPEEAILATEIPSLMDRARTAFAALRVLVRDSTRLDQVIALSDALNVEALVRGVRWFAGDPSGAALLREQLVLSRETVDVQRLLEHAPGTLGHEFASFVARHHIDLGVWRPIPGTTGAYSYVAHRVRASHDIWHVLTGYPPDPHGEILLQAFSWPQTGAPSNLVIAVVGTVKYSFTAPGFAGRVIEAYRRGRRAAPLGTVRWEDLWSVPVREVRRRLSIEAEAA